MNETTWREFHGGDAVIAGLPDFIVNELTDWVVSVIEAIGSIGVAPLAAFEQRVPTDPVRDRVARHRCRRSEGHRQPLRNDRSHQRRIR